MGFALGGLSFMIAPLGLAISPIEALRPVLVPGIVLVQLMFGSDANAITILLAFFLNILVFALPFLLWSLARQHAIKNRP